MDLRISGELAGTVEPVKEFVEAELVPLEGPFLAGSFRELWPEVERQRERVREEGWWGPQLPVELGGMGLDLVEFAHLSEVLGESPLGHLVFGCQAPDAGNLEILHAHGTEEQRRRYLKPLAAGRIRSCFAMTEPEMPGSNPLMLATRAVAEGDELVLEGRKWFVSAAEGAAFAIVMAVTSPEAPPAERASMVLVPTGTPGFERVRNIPVMGHAGEGYFSHAEVRLAGCRVPESNLLGREGTGFRIAQERLGPGRIHHCMRWLGICRRAFRMLCQRATSRRLTAEETLADQDIVQTWVAETAAEIESARLLTLRTARRVEDLGWREVRRDVSMIKFVVAGTLQRVVDRAIQVHGGLGVTDDTLLSFWYRQERAARIYDGPDEVHKLALGRRILREVAAKGRG